MKPGSTPQATDSSPPEWRVSWRRAARGKCRACGRQSVENGACWAKGCGFRPCEMCGRGTGSEFIRLCLACDRKTPAPVPERDEELERAIRFMKAEFAGKKARAKSTARRRDGRDEAANGVEEAGPLFGGGE